MMNTDTLQKENQIIDSITDTLKDLDASLDQMETTDSRLKAYSAQKEAISQMQSVVDQARRLDVLDGDQDEDTARAEGYDARQMSKALIKIDYTLSALDHTLEALQDDQASHLKAWYEQRKALHEIKKILHEIDRFETYDEDEMNLYLLDW